MSPALDNKVALVTGGSQGIGRAIADALATAGANVVVGDLREPADRPDTADWLRLDVTDLDSVEACVASIARRHGGLDIVVNNAGIMFEEAIATHDPASWQRMLDVNLTGPFLVTRAAIPHLEQRGGAIVNVGSIEGFSANPGHAAYAATKAGVHGLTVASAVDLGPLGIRVNAVAPGWIDTELNASFVDRHPDRDEVIRQLGQLHPVGHVGSPSDVADVVAWLAGDQARFVTGQIITIDGGRLARPPLPGILAEGG